MKLLSEGERFLTKRPWPFGRRIDVDRGRALAAELRSKAIDLSCSKATEFSSEIEELHLMAAKVALVTFGVSSPEIEPYEIDVFYYKAFEPPHRIVADYESFKSRVGI